MDNNLRSESSRTDPITGEVYPSGNPHADIQKSRIIGGAPQSAVYDPLPPAKPTQPTQPTYPDSGITKFCDHCGSVLVREAVICPTCGCQVAPLRQTVEQVPIGQIPVQQIPGQQIQIQQIPGQQPVQVIVNNFMTSGSNSPKDKRVALLLCFFFGYLGVHRFYEGRFGTGILWMMTVGLFGIGWIADTIRIACAPNPYYIK